MCCTYLIPHSLSSTMTYVSSLLKNPVQKKRQRRTKSASVFAVWAQRKVESTRRTQYKLYPILGDKASLPPKV